MGRPRDARWVHVTWLPGLMTGEKHCQWAPWFKSNFYFDKVPDGNMSTWSVKHNILLTEMRKELRGNGDTVLTEQNVRWTRDTGLVVSGAADLIAIHPDGTGTVYDLKAAKPRQSHVEQVLLYMYLLPRSNPRFAGMTISGEVVYEDSRIPLDAARIDADWESRLNYFLDLLDTDEPPERVPSEFECLYCKIASTDCADRMSDRVAPEEEEQLV